jgi:hypothetical protein
MRCFHLARAAILARVAGLGESVVPLLTWSGCLGIGPQPVMGLWENRRLRCFRIFGFGCFHKFSLPVVIGVNG